MRASRPRSCSRPSRSSTSRARTSAAACSSPPIRTGSELCLRPDLTIPVSRDYLASPEAGEALGFCYLAPVFRHRSEEPAEFIQGGIESFGRRDTAAADAEMLSLGLEATTHYGVDAPEIRMGDVGLFAALIAALDLAPAWKRRLVKDFNRAGSLAVRSRPAGQCGGERAAGISGRARSARRAPTRRPRMRWSPICCRSPASLRSAAARSARSRTASSNRRRSAQAQGCRARRAR